MDDVRLGRICRALRRRIGWRQADLAQRVGCHQTTISRLERGHLRDLSHRTIRDVFAAVDARYEGAVSWRGGALDRLLDEGHAALVEATVRRFAEAGWQTHAEVSFSEFGERGSIDVLALSREFDVVVIVEVKSELASVEETIRRHDVKVRLARRIVDQRFGWRPTLVVRLLVLPDTRAARKRVATHPSTFAGPYPDRSVAVRRWIEAPARARSGILFVPNMRRRSTSRRTAALNRVAAARPSVGLFQPTSEYARGDWEGADRVAVTGEDATGA